MYKLFYGEEFKNIVYLDLHTWNTSNVRNMRMMFCGCENLEELNIANWDTSKVRDMGYMF
jgi:surface protein